MSATPDPIEEMNELHVALGRQAAELAMQVLGTVSPTDIPVATAVALLKFGVELERKALLGAEADDGGGDVFDALAKAMGTPAPKETTPKEE